jgi:hypothetical protein
MLNIIYLFLTVEEKYNLEALSFLNDLRNTDRLCFSIAARIDALMNFNRFASLSLGYARPLSPVFIPLKPWR